MNKVLFAMISNPFKSKLVHVDDENGNFIHTSYLLGRNYKFPFLGPYDYEIGPCITREDFRGRGVYPDVLRYICSHIGCADSKFYMLVSPYNDASIRGIEKAGFQKVGEVERTPYLKIWKRR